MTREVLLAISGIQTSVDAEEDAVEVFTPGEYYYRNDKHFLLYEEVTEGFSETTKNIIKISDNYMELTKKGVTNVHMVFEKNKKNVTYYNTPYGSVQIGIEAKKVEVRECDSQIHMEVEYVLEMNCEYVADCKISIEVKPKGADGFSLGE